jgi:hypothetical protein
MSSNDARLLGLIWEIWGSLDSTLYGRKRQAEGLDLWVHLEEV